MAGAPFPSTVKPKPAPWMGFSRTVRIARRLNKCAEHNARLPEADGCGRYIEPGETYVDVKRGKMAFAVCCQCAGSEVQ